MEKIKYETNKLLFSPKFRIHLTIGGPFYDFPEEQIKKLILICENFDAFKIEPDKYSFSDEYFESFFIKIKNSKSLTILRDQIMSINKIEYLRYFNPHISLSYGDHSIKDKKILLKELPKLKKFFLIESISLVKFDELLFEWDELINFKLNL